MDVNMYFDGNTISTVDNCEVIAIKVNPKKYFCIQGIIIKPNGAATDMHWNKEGHTQLPELRKAGLCEYDTPHYDLNEESISIIMQEMKRIHFV